MGDVEFGKCGVCKEDKPLQRKYYRYNIDCECCGNEHFEYVAHCKDCTPVEPVTTRVTIKTSTLKKMSTEELMAVQTLCKVLKEDEAYRESWIANIVMAFKDEMVKSSIHSPNPDNFSYLVTPEMLHKISNQSAINFINQLIK